ncbi:MAG: pantoate--beta-alanine ligase [Acidimicrobiales bacterium]
MKTVETIAELRRAHDDARRGGAVVGLVPTMGYLHEGHLSLMRRARAECGLVTATIFVNPLQFGPSEDLASYPRDLPRDSALAEAAGVDLLFTPSVEEMYPGGGVLTSVTVREITDRFEGAIRPGHFAGVATVVAKLFAIAGPCRAFFGEKDYQQLQVVARMAADLSLPVEVIGCPTVREPDGLAMSSRNVYLDPAERRAAVVLKAALDAGAAAVERGERDPGAVEAVMTAAVAAEPLASLDYAAVVDPASLAPPAAIDGEVRLLIAARVGRPRLLDNRGACAPGRVR